jgi:thiol-disulfide isomerase/thioredoxin
MSPRTRLFILLAGGLLTGVILGMFVLFDGGLLRPFNQQFSPPSGGQIAGPSIGKPAPDFTIKSISGGETKLSEYHGSPIILNFWATWCGPCRLEMPLLESAAQKNGNRLTVLAVNSGESEEDVMDFKRELDLTFEIGIDTTGEAQKNYLIIGLPRTFMIDKDGIILAQHIGALSETQLEEYLELLEIPDD